MHGPRCVVGDLVVGAHHLRATRHTRVACHVTRSTAATILATVGRPLRPLSGFARAMLESHAHCVRHGLRAPQLSQAAVVPPAGARSGAEDSWMSQPASAVTAYLSAKKEQQRSQ